MEYKSINYLIFSFMNYLDSLFQIIIKINQEVRQKKRSTKNVSLGLVIRRPQLSWFIQKVWKAGLSGPRQRRQNNPAAHVKGRPDGPASANAAPNLWGADTRQHSLHDLRLGRPFTGAQSMEAVLSGRRRNRVPDRCLGPAATGWVQGGARLPPVRRAVHELSRSYSRK